MMRKWARHIIALVSLFHLQSYAQTDVGNLKKISIEDGLPSNTVYQIFQDDSHFMWIATEAGLCKYDGYRFTTYTVAEGLSTNDVEKIAPGDARDLWILSHHEMAVFQYETQSIMVVDTLDRISEYAVSDRLSAEDGFAWYYRDGKVYFVSAEPEVFIVRGPREEELHVDKFLFAEGNDLWAIKENRLIKIHRDYAVEEYHLAEGSKQYPFACKVPDKGIVYSSSQGLMLFQPGKASELILPWILKGFSDEELSGLYCDSNGAIWVSSKENGICQLIWDQGQLRLNKHLLNGKYVRNFFEDAEHNFWFATNMDGIFLQSRTVSQFAEWVNTGSVNPNEINSICQPDENNIWLGDEAGELQHLRRDQIGNSWSRGNSINLSSKIISIISIGKDSILVATSPSLYLINGGNNQKIDSIGNIVILKQAKNGDILIGVEDGIWQIPFDEFLKLLDPVSQEFITQFRSDYKVAIGSESLSLHKDKNNILWRCWSNSLYAILPDTSEIRLDSLDNVFRAEINDISETNDGSLWFGTQGSGLIRMEASYFRDQKDTLSIMDISKGMPSNICKQLSYDGKYLWVVTPRGIARLNPDKEDILQDNIIKVFDSFEGLPNASVRTIHPFGKRVWIATDSGLVVLETGKSEKDGYRPPVYVTDFWAKKKKIENFDSTPIVLDRKENTIRIRFTGIAYHALQNLRFNYHLERLGSTAEDLQWTVSSQNTAQFGELPAGKYRFTVSAITPEGIFSKPGDIVDFEIKPYFFETLWFSLGVIFLVIGLISLLLRFYYVSTHRKELSRKVAEQTADLSRERDELMRTNQELEQFSYAASHDLKTPLRTIIGHLQLLEMRYGAQLEDVAKEYIRTTVGNARRMYEMIDDLLDFARIGKLEEKYADIDLNYIFKEVIQLLDVVIKEKSAIVSADNLPVIWGSSTQWHMLMLNMIENGLKFNKSEVPEVRVKVEETTDYWHISFADNGIGIDKDYYSKVFKLFQRLHSTDFQGTGIGLAICKKIVEHHGGLIRLSSKLGEGTTFVIILPKHFKASKS